ncbi:hypothetical protein SGPA1_40257 [Streptomyces misionensis JCM 4497]
MGAQLLALTDSPVDGVHPRRPHGDTYLTRARVGLLGVHEVQDARTAELGEAHFLHATTVALTVRVLKRVLFCI